MENFPQVASALQQFQGTAAGLSAAIQGETQSQVGQLRVQDTAAKVKQSLEYLNNSKSSIEEYPDEYEDNAKKNASGPISGQISSSLAAFANTIESAQPFPDSVVSELKSVLEEFEKAQSLAKDNDATANNHYPGILHILPKRLDGAYEKLGGR